MPTDKYTVLYQGQLGNSVGLLATVGSGKQWIVKNMTLVNNDASDRTGGLYRGGATAAKAITPPNMVIKAGGMQEWDGTMAFYDGETIYGGASVAAQVTITISGDEIS